MSGDVFDCLDSEREDAASILWVETKEVAKHPEMHRMAPHNQGLFGSKCQYCQCEESSRLSTRELKETHAKLYIILRNVEQEKFIRR